MKKYIFLFVFLFGGLGVSAFCEGESSSVQLSSRRALQSPDWIRDAAIYKVFLRSFSDEGKFYNLEKRMVEYKNLGFTAIVLMPVFTMEKPLAGGMGSPELVKDFYGVDLEWGTKDMFKTLMQESHFNGVKIILSWPMGQISKENPIIGEHPEWLLEGSTEAVASGLPLGLNYQEPALQDYLVKAMIHWVKEYEIDGFEFKKDEQVPMEFWEKVRDRLSAIKPSLVLIGPEKPDYHLSVFNATYSGELYRLLGRIVRGEVGAEELKTALDMEKMEFPQGALRIRFSENEDTARAVRNFGDAHLAVAALILTMNGVPLIFSGQEIGEDQQLFLSEKKPIRWHEGLKANAEIVKQYKKLLELRSKHPALWRGQTFHLLTSNNKQLVAFARSYREDAVLVAINLSKEEFRGNLEVPEIFIGENGSLNTKKVFQNGDLKLLTSNSAEVFLPPWGFQVWMMK